MDDLLLMRWFAIVFEGGLCVKSELELANPSVCGEEMGTAGGEGDKR